MAHKNLSRREFLKKSTKQSTVLLSVTAVGGSGALLKAEETAPVDRHAVLASLGDTLIPSTPDPGYKSLETYNITAEVLKTLTVLSDSDLRVFNESCRPYFGEKTFLELAEDQRAGYLNLIIEGSQVEDTKVLRTLRKVYELARIRVFTVYYQNYPEHIVQRDENDVPVLAEGDEHQITNPNTKKIVTGWDIAGYEPQLSWKREEERRARVKRLGMWIEE